MKSEFFNYGKLMIGLALLLFSGLALGQSGGLDPTWVRPDTDFSKYTKFLVEPLDLPDVKIVRPPWGLGGPLGWDSANHRQGSHPGNFYGGHYWSAGG